MALHDEITSDLSEVFSTDDFGTSATYYVSNGSAGATISLIALNEYDAAELHSARAEAFKPFAICRTSDVSGATHDSYLVIGANTWRVIEIQPHTRYLTKLILSRDVYTPTLTELTPQQLAAFCQAYFDSTSGITSNGYLRCVPTFEGVPFENLSYAELTGADNALRHDNQDFTLFGWFLLLDGSGPLYARDNSLAGTNQCHVYAYADHVAFDFYPTVGDLEGVNVSIPGGAGFGWHFVVVRYNAATLTVDLTVDNTRDASPGGVASITLASPLRNGQATTYFGRSSFFGIAETVFGGLRNWGWCKGDRLSDGELTTLWNNGFNSLPYPDIPEAIRAKVDSFWHFSGYDYVTLPNPGYLDSVGSAHFKSSFEGADIQLYNQQTSYKGTGAYFWIGVNVGNALNGTSSANPAVAPIIRANDVVDVAADRYFDLQGGITQGATGYVWAVIKVPANPIENDLKMILRGGPTDLSCMLLENKPQVSVFDDLFGGGTNDPLTPDVWHLVEWHWSPTETSTRVDGENLVVGGAPDPGTLGTFSRVSMADGESDYETGAGFQITDLAVSSGDVPEIDRLNIEFTLMQKVEALNA